MIKNIYKKNLLSLFLALAMVISILPAGVFAANGTLSGEGTAESPYLIEDAADLKAFRDLVNATDSSTAYAKLTADIDLEGEEWTPFASKSNYATTAYAGVFDGDFYTIKGLSINSGASNQGLFGLINGATIKNLKVEGSVTSSNNYVGGIVGKVQQGTIENCSFSGSVTTTKSGGYAGGITGYAGNGATQTATITGCANSASVSGETKGTVGGIVGYAKYTEISNSYNAGKIKGATRSGGIAGQLQNNCTASGCYNIGTVSGSATAADICDFLYSNSSLTNCYYETQLSGAGTGTSSNCSEITTAADLLKNLGSAFVSDSSNINRGYPVLLWQTSSTSVDKNPHITISGSNKLNMTNNGQSPQTTLTVQYFDMDDTPRIQWSVKDNSDIITLEAPQNADESNKSVVITAVNPGKATVTAMTTDGTYMAELEISVIPFITTVEIEGTVAVNQTVYAKINILGGDEYDYENYPELTVQWKYLTNDDYTAGNTGSGSYQTIPGAINREFEITGDLEGAYLSFELLFDGEYKTPNRPVKITSAAEGILSADKAELEIDTADIKESKTLELSENGRNGSAVTWASSDDAVINSETGVVTLPESGISEITLTATLSYGGYSDTKTFSIKVYSQKAIDEEKANKVLQLEKAAASLGEYYTMYPVFGTDTNVKDVIRTKLEENGYTDIDISVKNVEEVYGGAAISDDGIITYFYADPNSTPAIKNGSYNVTFTLTCDDAAYDFAVPVVVYWDVEKVKDVMAAEILNKVTIDAETPISENISLPKVIDDKKWTLISWTSSDEKIISVSNEKQQTADTLFDPYVGVVKQGAKDEIVILTATFTFMLTNDVTGNETPITLNKVFEITVKALDEEQLEKIKKDLAEKLDTGFSAAGISDAVTGEALMEENNGYTVYNDIQFPTTADFGVDGKYYPITITSDSEAVKAPDVNNAARVEVYRPAVGKDDAKATVAVTISDKDTNVTASKDFDLIIPALTQKEVDSEKALMAKVKASYFEGIKGTNSEADNISKDLKAFVEVYEEDGELVWIRKNADKVNHGIVPVAMDGWEELEAWRLFKSSNPAAITHENLIVSVQNNAKAVTISSALSSETLGKYGELYLDDPVTYADYADLAELYYQEVSQDLVIRGKTTVSGAKPVAVAEKIDVTFRLQSSNSTLISTTSYTDLNETTTVYDIFKKALSENGYTYKNRGSYVYSITAPDGTTLEELDEGANSGWMYKVNKKVPDVYMGGYGLKDGDDIVVFFTKDYTEVTGSLYHGGSSLSTQTEDKTDENESEDINKEDTESAAQFTDISGHWAEKYIISASELGLMTGVGNDKFAPDNTLTRAMFVTILYRLEEEPEASESKFTDIEVGSWYDDAVAWASVNGIVKGVSDLEFDPNANITREQISALIYRYAKYKGIVSENSEQLEIGYADNDDISDWAIQAVIFCNAAEIMIGNDKNEFNPLNNATRAEAAKIFVSLSDKISN